MYSFGDNPIYLSIAQVHLPPEDAEAELDNGDDSRVNIKIQQGLFLTLSMTGEFFLFAGDSLG
jgi:hypothetical protein